MAGVNKVIIMGNLGRDPELSYTQGGMAMCKFSLATSKKKKDGEEVTSWHRCTAWGRTAEVIAQYVGKGQQLYIEGELVYGQYEKDGIVRYTTDIFVNEFTFVGPGKNNQQQGYEGGQSFQNQGYQQPQQFQQRQGFQQNAQQRSFNPPPQQNFQQPPPQSQPEPPYPGDDYGFNPPKDDDIPF
jgi:single-strand DNA-binding protein